METYKADRIVTINVDVQNDFCPGGSLAVTGGDEIITPLNELNDFTRQNNGTVVFTGDQHPVETEHFNKWPVHCVAGTEGAALRQGLTVLEQDVIVDKGMGQTDGYSAFEGITRDGRTLEEIITPVNKERVLVALGGLATDFCVLASALDAAAIHPHDGEIRVIVARETIRGVNLKPEDSDEAIKKMATAGIQIVNLVTDITNNTIIEIA